MSWFSQEGFMPHIHCYLTRPSIVWTMFFTDMLIGISYVGISLTLWGLIKKIKIQFNFVVLCFGVFILACGLTHFMEVWTLWNPDYWVAASVKFVTSIASVGTGVYLWQLRHPIVTVAEAAKLAEQRKLDLEALTTELETRVHATAQEIVQGQIEFKAFFDHAAVGMAQVDIPSGFFYRANRKFCEIVGYSQDELKKLKPFDITFSEDREEDTESFLQFAEGRAQTAEKEKRYVRKDGKIVWVLLSDSVIHDNNGKPLRTASVVIDITQHKIYQNRIQESEKLLDQIFSGSPSFMAFHSLPDYRYEKSNEEYLKLIGHNNIFGKTARDILPEGEAQGYIELLDQVSKTGHPFYGREMPLTFANPEKSGSKQVFLDFVFQPLKLANGEVYGIAVQGYDVTEKVFSRKAVENERQNFRNLFKQTPEMVCIFYGPEHVFEFVNEAHTKTLGFDATGLKVREAQPESVEVHGILDEVYRTGRTAQLHEIPITVKDRLRYFNLTFSARRDERGNINGIILLGPEVTNEVLNREKLSHALQARDEFLSIASHELKTPLTPLKIQLQSLIRSIRRGTLLTMPAERIDKVATTSEKQITRLTHLIENLLDVSRINSGKLTLNFEEVDLFDLVQEVVERFRPQANQTGSSIEIDAQDHIVGWVDRLRVEQVVVNLLSNAIKYAPGKPIHVSLEKHEDTAKICVRDFGVGIDEKDLERIFDRFERLGSYKNVGGLGLGLYITRQIMNAHGGKIEVQSKIGDGTYFIAHFPLKCSENRAMG